MQQIRTLHLARSPRSQTGPHAGVPCTALLLAMISLATAAEAQQPRGLDRGPTTSVTVAGVASGETDLDDGDSIRFSRAVIGAQVQWGLPSRASVGVGLQAGRTSFRFGSGVAGMESLDIDEFSMSLPVSLPVGANGRAFLAPSLSRYAEAGSAGSDGLNQSLIAGVGWRLSPDLFIGPGVGISSSLRDDTDASVFPILLVDWDFAPGWSLSTGGGFGATRGPGLRLAHAPGGDWEFGLEARIEEFEFALDGDGALEDGVGRDRYTPVLLTARYAAGERVSVSGFVGAALGGRLTLYDEEGEEVYDETYEPTPLMGLSVALRF